MNNLPVNVTDSTTGNVQTVAGVIGDARTPSGAAEVVSFAYGFNGTTEDRLRTATATMGVGASLGILAVQALAGILTSLNITAAAVVKASPGRSFRVNVIVAGSTAGGLHDTTTTGAAAAANQIAAIPNAIGTYEINAPHANGIVVVPGTGQTLAIIYQ